MIRKFWIFPLVLAVFTAGAAANADELESGTPVPPASFVSEVRAGLFAHDMYWYWLPYDFSLYHFDQIQDVNLEVLFRLPDADVVRWLGSPKVNAGATINLNGLESAAHLALTWHVPVGETPVFLEASIGGGIHNGLVDGTFKGSGQLRPLGSRVLFYSSAGIGVDFSDKFYGLLSYEHYSNAGLASQNYGLSNMGIKFGMKLD